MTVPTEQPTLNKKVAVAEMPHLPSQAQPLVRQAVGHLPDESASSLLERLLERTARGAEKFGHAWRGRNNSAEGAEETVDAVVYAAHEEASLEEGLTPVPRGSHTAAMAREELHQAARYAAIADHHFQMAERLIWGGEAGQAP